jgi:hypothetical protein
MMGFTEISETLQIQGGGLNMWSDSNGEWVVLVWSTHSFNPFAYSERGASLEWTIRRVVDKMRMDGVFSTANHIKEQFGS